MEAYSVTTKCARAPTAATQLNITSMGAYSVTTGVAIKGFSLSVNVADTTSMAIRFCRATPHLILALIMTSMLALILGVI